MEGQSRGPGGGDLWLRTANPPWRNSHMVGWPRHWTSSDAWRWQAERLCLRPPTRADSRGAIQPMLSRAPLGLAPKLDHPAPPYHLHLSSASLCPHDASSEAGDCTPVQPLADASPPCALSSSAQVRGTASSTPRLRTSSSQLYLPGTDVSTATSTPRLRTSSSQLFLPGTDVSQATSTPYLRTSSSQLHPSETDEYTPRARPSSAQLREANISSPYSRPSSAQLGEANISSPYSRPSSAQLREANISSPYSRPSSAQLGEANISSPYSRPSSAQLREANISSPYSRPSSAQLREANISSPYSRRSSAQLGEANISSPYSRPSSAQLREANISSPYSRPSSAQLREANISSPCVRPSSAQVREASLPGSCPQYGGSHASPHSQSPPAAPDAARASPPVHRAHRASGRSRDEILGDIERQRAFRYAALASRGLQRERGGRVPLLAPRDGGASTGARASREHEARLHHQAVLRAKHDLAACHQSLVYERQKPTDALRSRIAPSHRGVHARSGGARGAASAAVRDYDRFIAGSDASLRPHSAAAATRQAPEWVPYSCAISRYVGPTSSGGAAGGKRPRKKNGRAARARAEAEARREEELAAQEKAKKPSYWALLRVLGLSAIDDSGVVSSSCEADEVDLPPEVELGVTKIEVSVPSIPNVRFDLPRPRSDPTRADWESVIS